MLRFTLVLSYPQEEGIRMYARIIASLIGYSANEAVEYDFVLFDRGQMAHGVSFMKQNEMSLFNISVLYVPAQYPE